MPDTHLPAVLFVCLGNICRSPMAEGALRQRLAAAGRVLAVDSAGTGDWHLGEAPDPRACRVALAHGADIRNFRARQVVPADFQRFSRIFALDRQNLADLERLRPAGSAARLSLLLDSVPGFEGQDVPDPYYGDAAAFEAAWAAVDRAAAALVAALPAGRV